MLGNEGSRRWYLKIVGTLGLTGMAGCQGRGIRQTVTDQETNSPPPEGTPTNTRTPTDPEPEKIASDDGEAHDGFGSAVAFDGTTALIGANHDTNTNGEFAGAVYVFEWTGEAWNQRTKLLAEDGTTTGFGTAIALEGDRALIGAPGTDTTGAVYVFERDDRGWNQQARFSPYSEASNDRKFGTAVALSGDTALTGEFWTTGLVDGRDSAYIFEQTGDTWTQTTTLSSPEDLTMYQFGWAGLALRDDTAFVGATEYKGSSVTTEDGVPVAKRPKGHRAGSVFIFEKAGGTWNRTARLTASDRAKFDKFGSSIALSGDTVVIGAIGDENEDGVEVGAAYIFERDAAGWRQLTKLTGDRRDHEQWSANHGFSEAVAIESDTVVVGAPSAHDPNGVAGGAVYEYTQADGGWTQVAKHGAPDGDSGDEFGKAIAVDGGLALVGAWRDEDPYGTSEEGEGPGSAYVLDL